MGAGGNAALGLADLGSVQSRGEVMAGVLHERLEPPHQHVQIHARSTPPELGGEPLQNAIDLAAGARLGQLSDVCCRHPLPPFPGNLLSA